MKTYVITLAKTFPKGHPKEGELTNFKEKLLRGEKIHTIRCNAKLWEDRIIEIADGKAKLSVRQWSGRPYHSPQEVIAEYTAKDGIGGEFINMAEFKSQSDKYGYLQPVIAHNDGLSFEDWQSWFKSDLEAPRDYKLCMIIHFTKFRYIQKYGH